MKKMGRKFWGLLFALLLVVPSSAFAVTLEITNATAAPSDIVQMKLMTEDFTDVAGVQIFIEFDTSKVEFHSMATSYIQSWTTNVTDGKIFVIWEDLSSPLTLPAGEPLFQFNLQAAADAADSAFVKFSGNIELVDEAGDPLSVTLQDGYITFIPLSADDLPGALPVQFVLEQNYPNPFNPSTTISYTVKKTGQYTFEIFNLAGQLIDKIELGNKPAGTYEYIFSGDKLPSGVYTYRLTGNNQSTSRQMILLK
ncbi:MAG: T9SS type A sorting domain-containing protein [candidate division Zixibacteria bacterium]